MNEYIVTIMRRGAWKPQVVATSSDSLLSLCQIFESTDDVTSYSVGEIDFRTYEVIDIYLPPSKDFPKWIPIKKAANK